MPQRTAHGWSAGWSARRWTAVCRLADLSLEDFREVDPTLDESVYDVLGVEKAVAAHAELRLDRSGAGSPANRAMEGESRRRQ